MAPRSSRGPRAAVLAAAVLAATACTPPPAARPPAPPGATRVVFVGDSLVNRSAEDHGLLSTISALLSRRHPARRYELVNAGENGNRIADIRARLGRDVLALHPDAVVLYWDSDVSESDEAQLAAPERERRRVAYEGDLVVVLRSLLAAGTRVLVSGPTLIGERWDGRNPKDGQLDRYRNLNREVAARLGIAYIDTRQAALAWLEEHRARGEKLLLTEDGEHLNQQGASLVANVFARALAGRPPHRLRPGRRFLRWLRPAATRSAYSSRSSTRNVQPGSAGSASAVSASR